MDTTNEITPEESVIPVYLIPMDESELADMAQQQLLLDEQISLFVQREQARQSALAKLEAIGLTTEEITALIGGN